MMRSDFCAFILTHGRPNKVATYETLMKSGYTGKVYIVIDDEDKTADEYRQKFGDKVLQFCKKEVASRIDEGDNFNDRRAIIYARNVCWELAQQVGCKYFIQLDDDYDHFSIKFGPNGSVITRRIKVDIDELISCVLDFYIKSPFATLAYAQGGDYIGGAESLGIKIKRKAMNTFLCSTDRPFKFFGRVNEDVNTYVADGRRGRLFGTITNAWINQATTQTSGGGMTELYLDSGTYIKTFYSVMYAPSCVKVGELGDPRSPHYRIHHDINWNNAVPKILREKWRANV